MSCHALHNIHSSYKRLSLHKKLRSSHFGFLLLSAVAVVLKWCGTPITCHRACSCSWRPLLPVPEKIRFPARGFVLLLLFVFVPVLQSSPPAKLLYYVL